MTDICQSCSKTILLVSSRLSCDKCNSLVHIKCLKSNTNPLPTALLGDTFFSLICSKCSTTNKEVVKRVKINWLTAITVALYNLTSTDSVQRTSRNGFFHWKLHIAGFIDQNWSAILGPQMKKRKTWLGTISGTLSNWSGEIFQNGCQALSEQGWWGLVDNRLPADLISDALAAKAQGVFTSNKLTSSKARQVPENFGSEIYVLDSTNVSKRTRGVQSSIETAMALKEKRATLFEAKDIRKQMQLTSPSDASLAPLPKIEKLKPRSTESQLSIVKPEPDDQSPYDEIFDTSVNDLGNTDFDKMDFGLFVDDSVRTSKSNSEEKVEISRDSTDLSRTVDICKEPEETKTIITVTLPKGHGKPLTGQVELDILHRLEKCPSLDRSMKILKLKLKVRKQLRERHLTVFDFDSIVKKIANDRPDNERQYPFKGFKCPLDLLQVNDLFETNQNGIYNILLSRDPSNFQKFTSQYTTRVLKPFIRRSYEILPPKLRLFEELLDKTRSEDNFDRQPIDFLYFRPYHLTVVNNVAREFFWPSIDLSECLSYPDYSCIVMYGHVLVAFALMVPDVSNTECYIPFVFTHPEWRRAGIAKFMIYHLCQSCPDKDITLHVPTSSNAVLMYQKFGFKIEYYVKNFYDRYLTITSTECRDALFMRLSQPV